MGIVEALADAISLVWLVEHRSDRPLHPIPIAIAPSLQKQLRSIRLSHHLLIVALI
ncbi:MAG: hypothetical protein AAF215_18650 [Cyanobacteria bacterium P01_A01_bin.123]